MANTIINGTYLEIYFYGHLSGYNTTINVIGNENDFFPWSIFYFYGGNSGLGARIICTKVLHAILIVMEMVAIILL